MWKDYLDWLKRIFNWQIKFRSIRKYKSLKKRISTAIKKFKLKEVKKDIKYYLKYKKIRPKKKKLIFDKYNKFFVIYMSMSNAGFFTYLLFVLNQLNYCEKKNYYPVIYFGEYNGKGGNPFYEDKYGDNMWDYYFEPVKDHTYSEIMEMVKDSTCSITEKDITKLSRGDLRYMHQHDPKSIFAYTYGYYKYKRKYDEEWYKKHRDKANHFIKKYIRIKEGILKEIDEFYNKFMKGQNILGVHIRGTDKGSAKATSNAMRIVEPEEYILEINKYLNKYPLSKILVATDQEQYIEFMKEKYNDRIIYYPAIRSTSKLAPFQIQDGNNHRKGKDVLIECLLLSKCQFLLKCTSTVGEAAHWFNPDLDSIDMNYLY